MNCVFFNDTCSQNNWGCHATTFYSKKKLESLGFIIKYNMTLEESLKYDNITNLVKNIKENKIKYIFINGEGSLYEQKDIKGKNMIKFMKLSKDINTNIYLINSGFDLKSKKNIESFSDVITNKLNIYLREPFSIENFKKFYPEKEIFFQPDYLYLSFKEFNNFNHENILNKYNLISKDYIVIGGNSNYYRPDRPKYKPIKVYTNIIKNIKKITNKKIILYASSDEEIDWLRYISVKCKIDFYNVNNTKWDDAFVLLSNAYLSISGRYHPTIMSLIGLTPCLMFSANHCKMDGVNKMFFKDQKVINSHKIHENHDYILNFVKKYENIDLYIKAKNKIKKDIESYYELINKIKYQ